MGAGGVAFVHAAVSSNPAVFHALSPVRVFDTRTGAGGVAVTPLGPNSVLDVQMTGVNGVPSNATAVVLNVTVVDGTGPSFLTVWPTGDSMPLASSLNWTGPEATPNGVTAPIGAGGKVSFYNQSGHVNVLADVSGYYTAADQPPFTHVAAQTVNDPALPASLGQIASVSLTLPDACPGTDSWRVLVQADGYYLTGGGSGGTQRSATVALGLDPATFTNGTVQNQNFDADLPGQFREAYSTSFLFTVDSGTRTFYELGSTNHPSGITAAQNNLMAESVSVSC
jgi:hypothetical protein